MILICLTVWLLILIVVPPGFTLFRWFNNQKYVGFPLASLGASLMLISFFLLPWLNLQPLKLVALEWIYDAVPFAGVILRFLGIDSIDTIAQMTEFVDILDLFFFPRGWLTLALTASLGMWFIILVLGTTVFVLAQWVAWKTRGAKLGWSLIVVSALLLVLLFLNISTIDGMGERPFPHPLTVVIPFLGAHIEWGGPLIMLVALTLLLSGGIQTIQQTETGHTETDHSEGHPPSQDPS